MATRLYLSNGTAHDVTTLWGVTPAFAAWTETTNAVRRAMYPDARQTALTDVAVTSAAAGNSVLHRQLVSLPMIAGLAFTTATTFKCQIMGFESAANDNIINRVRCVKIVSRDGTTIQSTQIALGNAASVVEWNTTNRNLSFLTGQTGQNYTTVAGDRLVLEVGHKDSAGLSISGSLRWGAASDGTGDLGENETDTTNTLRPWFETSLTLTFEASSPPPRNRERRLLIPNRDFDPWSATGWAV